MIQQTRIWLDSILLNISLFIFHGAAYGHKAIIELLLEKGANPNEGMIGAASKGHPHIVAFLLDKGADPNGGISKASRKGHQDIVALLLHKGAEPIQEKENNKKTQ